MDSIKTSFVMHNETIDITDELSNEEAGILFKTILAKVNGREYEIEDRTLRLIFKPIDKQLDRDLKKYENKLQEKSNAGKIGNLKRWNPDIYEEFQKGKIDINEALKIAEDRKASHRDKNIANIAVNDSDSENENASVNENLNEKDDVDVDELIPIRDAANFFWKNKEVKIEYAKTYNIPGPEQLKKLMEEFMSECIRNGKSKKTIRDFSPHFNNWLRDRKERKKNTGSSGRPNGFDDVNKFYKNANPAPKSKHQGML